MDLGPGLGLWILAWIWAVARMWAQIYYSSLILYLDKGKLRMRLRLGLWNLSPNSACTEGSWRCWFRSAHEPAPKAETLRVSIFPCNLQYFVTPTLKNT